MHPALKALLRALLASAALVLTLLLTGAAGAATLPSGFSEALVAEGLAAPTAMAFAPDGRLFVTEQGGRVRVIGADGRLRTAPFATLEVDERGERGLLGIAFDPAFAVNSYVYLYSTAGAPYAHNRITRVRAAGDVAVADSQTVILQLNPLSEATNHNGGALHFGPDGKLYAAVGDNANGANAQRLDTLLGKILRLNPDGSVPADNPFVGSATGVNAAVWALGLRNPFTFTFARDTGRMFVNDVGQAAWEEINDGVAGGNYGWPESEGPTSDPRFRSPVYAYRNGTGTDAGCAITGGAFYNPPLAVFPPEYVGDYFFADFCGGWIRRLDATDGSVAGFASGIGAPVDLTVGDDGALYVLARAPGSVTRIFATSSAAPGITRQPASQTVAAGRSASFSVAASGAPPLTIQWQRDGVDIPGATGATYTLLSAQVADSGARFRARLTNTAGAAMSAEAVLTVTPGSAPTGTIETPPPGALYRAGDTIAYSGSAADAEDGTLPASAFTWRVDFHHDLHSHPTVPATSGVRGGSFTIPTSGETSANVWYRIVLTVQDSAGLSHTSFRDVRPRTAAVRLASDPPGLELRLDGQPVTAPVTFTGVVGVERTVSAPSPQTLGGRTWVFERWSDGGAPLHTISTPESDTTLTAVFRPVPEQGRGLRGEYFGAANLSGSRLVRTDAAIDFDWAAGSPDPLLGSDGFSVRWTGELEPRYSESYTLTTSSDDGVRLWVDGRLLIDHWNDHPVTDASGTLTLIAGRRYSVRLEYYENRGLAAARLTWASASQTREPIPANRLSPPSS